MAGPLILRQTFDGPANPLDAFPAYREFARKEREAQAKHQRVKPIREARRVMIHAALQRGRCA